MDHPTALYPYPLCASAGFARHVLRQIGQQARALLGRPPRHPARPDLEPDLAACEAHRGHCHRMALQGRGQAKEGVTINALDPDMLEFVDILAEREGDSRSGFLRKCMLMGLSMILCLQNKSAWRQFIQDGEGKETT